LKTQIAAQSPLCRDVSAAAPPKQGTLYRDDNQHIMVPHWTSCVDEISIATALANLKTTYSDFAAANGKD
jgi:hypothetical protein